MTVALLAPDPTLATAPTPSTVLSRLFGFLDGYSQPIQVPTLVDHLEGLDLPQAAFSSYTDFDPGGYTRTLLHSGPAYEALSLCWLPGQHSAIHDHRGSNCAFRVLMGRATETIYAIDGQGLAHTGDQNHYTTGFVAASSDLDVHRVSNLEGEDLVTLHIYSPPLERMGTYTAAPTPAVFGGAPGSRN